MPGLSIIVLTEDAERLRGALTLALAHDALGHRTRIFLQLDAVRLLAKPLSAPRDADHIAAGLPGFEDLMEEVLASGISVTACQSGLALAQINAADLDHRIEAGGPVSFLQSLEPDERLSIL